MRGGAYDVDATFGSFGTTSISPTLSLCACTASVSPLNGVELIILCVGACTASVSPVLFSPTPSVGAISLNKFILGGSSGGANGLYVLVMEAGVEFRLLLATDDGVRVGCGI